MTVFTYSRVSTGRQASEGESLDVQQSRAAAYAMAMIGQEASEAFVERGISGTVPFRERPEGARLWASLKAGDAIVACKLDRCFRSALDGLETLSALQTMGVRLYLIDMGGDVTGNGIAKLVFTILSAVAEMERERTRERVAETKAHQRKQGRYLGGTVPFGYARAEDGSLTEDTAQQTAIARMRDLRTDGLSLRAVADKMAGEGVKISFKAISDILARTATI